MNVIIVAGGLGTRFKELSCFPKILLPTKEYDSILLEQLEYFKNDEVTIIINEKYYKMLLNYVGVNSLNVHVVPSSNTNGSGNTIASVYEELPKKNVLFFWSDIVFEKNSFKRSGGFRKPNSEVVVYTSNDDKYRYLINDGVITNVSDSYNGNIPGVFFIKNLSHVISYPQQNEVDLVDLIIQSQQDEFIKNVTEEPLPANIIEYKSLEDYKEILGQNDYKKAFARLNNQWEINNDYTINNCNNYAEHLDWSTSRSYLNNDTFKLYYNTVSDQISFNEKDISSYDLFVNCSNETKENALDNLANLICKEKLIQKQVSNEIIINELKQFVNNAFKSLDKIDSLLINKNDKINKIINKFYTYILDYFKDNTYICPTHYNINEYTILVNKYTYDVKLIHHKDGSNYFGIPEFDLASYYRIKSGIDELMRTPVVYLDESIYSTFKAYNTEMLKDIPLIYRLTNILQVISQLPTLGTDVMKVNIMYEWMCIEINNIYYDYFE